MKNLFVTYELSLKAKLAGFDEECITFWSDNGKSLGFNNKYSSISKGYNQKDLSKWDKKYGYGKADSFRSALEPELCLAPTYQQLIDWFRKHKIEVSARLHYSCASQMKYFSSVIKETKSGWASKYDSPKTYPYYEALNLAIEEAFKLIKK